MDTQTIIASMSVAVNRLVEAFKLGILSRYPDMPIEQRKAALLVVSMIAGILVALVTPGSADVFNRSFLGDNPLAAQILLGVLLAFGSEVVFWALKLTESLSKAVTPNTTTETESVTVEKTVTTPVQPTGTQG